jgi:hypothetical protein
MKFGEFLVGKGVLKSKDIEQILKIQEKTNVWFGTLAYVLGYINIEQVTQIQLKDGGDPRFFAETAVKLGFLTPQQVNKVLQLQNEKYLKFGEVAVALRRITAEQLRVFLEEFSGLPGDKSDSPATDPADVRRRPVTA